MDVDIDFVDRNRALSLFKHIAASTDVRKSKKHNTGIYFQNIPFNPVTNQSTIEYKEAEDRGYFKIDFLNVSAYSGVKDEEHLIRLMNTEPSWDLFEESSITDNLFHVNGHSDLLKKMKPKSIEQLAAVLALIRPAKRHLVGRSWDEIFNEVWDLTGEAGYAFKHSHAIAYAVVIVVQLNLLVEQSLNLSN